MRYATWSAVSTKSQAAEDKVSLAVQREKCRAAGESRGWRHVRDYSVPGQSRSAYISLTTAEKHIPQLHQMLEDAYRGAFDVLVVYDLDRFRSLMDQIFFALSDCNVQLYVLSDPREPVDPSAYDDERKNEMSLLIGVRRIISDNQVNNLARHYRDKMPRRVTDKRLHPGLGLPPFGYHKPPGQVGDRNAVLVQDAAQVAILRQIKDWFFAGASLTEIARRLNDQGTPSPRGARWWYTVVKYLLANPFYAGVVGFGYTRRMRIRREGIVKRYKGEPVEAQGAHQPVWDANTHQRILAELERRGQAHPGPRTRALSRLLYCWCGSVLWAQTVNGGSTWRCSSRQRGHINIKDDDALDKVTNEIVHTLTHQDDLQLPSPIDQRPGLQAELKDLQARKKRWMDLYETGALDDADITKRIQDLTTQIRKKQAQLRVAAQTLADRAATRATLQELANSVQELPGYYRTGPGEQVNAELHAIIQRVDISPEKEIAIVWR